MAIDPVTAALLLEGGRRSIDNFSSNRAREREIEARGVDIPWTQKWLPKFLGPLAGGEIQKNIYETKLGRYAESDATALRQSASAGVTAAAVKMMESQKRIINEQVASSIQQERVGRAGRGVYNSGAGFDREQDIRQSGTNALANALAQTGLQAQDIAQRGEALTLQGQIQQGQAQFQKQQAENQMWGDIFNFAMPYIFKADKSGTDSMGQLMKLLELSQGQQTPQMQIPQNTQTLPFYNPAGEEYLYDDYVG